MRRMTWLVIGAVLGGAGIGGALQYHVVQTNDGFTCVHKQSMTLADTYVDVRQWGPTDWAEHPELALTLVQHGHKDFLNEQTLETGFKNSLHFK